MASFVVFWLRLSLTVFIFSYPALAQDNVPPTSPPEKIFNAQMYKLDNGLHIYVIENHRAPVVTQMLWYRVGSADEHEGKSGIAHFLEHLMFKGQTWPGLGTYGPGEFSKIIRSLGGNDNAFTGRDYTAYHQSIAKEHLEKIMQMEAGRMRGLNISEEDVASENKVILEERRQRIDNDPRARFGEQMNYALFPNHPYGKPNIGWFHEMAGLTRDDARAFYDRWYAPNNAILIVAGDVTGDEVFALANKTYGLLPANDNLPVRVRTSSPPFISQNTVKLAHPSIRQEVFIRDYRASSCRANKTDCLALQVLAEIMGGGPTTRLYKSLVVDQKIASSVSLSYDSTAWDDTTIDVSATPAPGRKLEEMGNAVDAELRKLIKDSVTEVELREAKTRMQAEAVYARDSLMGPAMILGQNLITGATLDDIEYWPRDIEGVTAQQVQDVARRFLNPDAPTETPPVEGYLLPGKEAAHDTAAPEVTPAEGDAR